MFTCGNCKKQHTFTWEARECYNTSGKNFWTNQARKPVLEEKEHSDGHKVNLALLTHEDEPWEAPVQVIRQYLFVPFAEKDKAKGLGAKWDKDKKQWWIASDNPAKVSMPLEWFQKTAGGKTPAAEGFYERDGVIYKVLTAQYGDAAGQLYCKRLVLVEREEHEMDPKHPDWTQKGTWEKAVGMQFQLTPEELLPIEEQIRYGKLYGFCVRCGKTLTLEESQERGMGPTCAGKAGL